jgi:hypothetical protein
MAFLGGGYNYISAIFSERCLRSTLVAIFFIALAAGGGRGSGVIFFINHLTMYTNNLSC